MNQYRCETCENRRCPLPKYYSDNSEKFETGLMHKLSEIVGCASHSDFQNPRESVLNELRNFIEKNVCDGSCPFDSMNKNGCFNYTDCGLCIYDHGVLEISNKGW